MAWIELHQTLPNHKKTSQFRQVLKIKKAQAVGHLCMLWLWALDAAPDGDLTGFTPEDIAEASGWTGKNSQLFVDALQASGYVDENLMLHDWDDYAGRLMDKRDIKREQDRIRQQRRRDKLNASSDSHDNVTRDSRVNHATNSTVPYPTVPNPTVPNSTRDTGVPPIPPEGGDGEGDAAPEPDGDLPSPFDTFWASYPKKVGKEAARKSWNRIHPNKELQAKIADAIDRAKASSQWLRDNGRFIPNPATWLNQGRWDDEYDVWAPEHKPEYNRGSRVSDIDRLARLHDEFVEEGK